MKCSLSLPISHIVGKMHMSSKCTQHVITGFQAPSPQVEATSLKDVITIFNPPVSHPTAQPTSPPANMTHPNTPTPVYTDGACNNNSDNNAAAGYGVWYGSNDP